MMMNEQYIQKDIMFIVKSEIRLKILTELNDKPQTIKEIVNKTKMAYSSVSNNLNILVFITSTFYYLFSTFNFMDITINFIHNY